MAKRTRKPVEGQSLALVADLLRHGGARARLRCLSISNQHLENRARGNRLVHLWPQHGGKDSHAGYGNFVVRRTGKITLGASVGSPTWHADVLHRSTNRTVEYRRCGNCLFLPDSRRDVAKLSGAFALPLRSLVGKTPAATYPNARDDRD